MRRTAVEPLMSFSKGAIRRRTTGFGLGLLAALAVASPTRAFAADDDDGRARTIRVDARDLAGPPRERVWYGWQPLIPDAVSLAVLGAAIGTHDRGLEVTGFGLGGLGSMAHVFHDHPGKFFASFGLRLAAPMAAAWTGHAIDRRTDRTPSAVDVGALAGWVVAMAIDDALLAREEREPRVAKSDAIDVRPAAAALRDGATVGIVGSF